jgi:hypothetical protein
MAPAQYQPRGSAPYARDPQERGDRVVARRADPGISGMQVAGILFLVASVLRLVQHHLLAPPPTMRP